jgi:hypothetical protein
MLSPDSVLPTSRTTLPRRSVVRAGAWSIPVVAAATATPAFAASVCSTDFSYALDWGSSGSNFSRAAASNTATAGAASAMAQATGATNMTVNFTSALITTGSGASTSVNGYALDTTYNLSVPGPANNNGGLTPNVTNLGNIVANGSERGLCLQHTTSTAATTNATTGNPDRGQRLTISFPRAVTGLSFWIVDIDTTTTGYWDRVRFTNATPTVSNRAANINGDGVGTLPFRYGTALSDSNVDENSANARVKVTFPGSITSLVMEYWSSAYTSSYSIQRVYLSDFSFTARGC